MIPPSSSTSSSSCGLINNNWSTDSEFNIGLQKRMPCSQSSLGIHEASNFPLQAIDTFELTVLVFVALVVIVSVLANKILRHLRRQPFPQTGSVSKHSLPACPVPPHPLFGHMAHIASLPTSIEYVSFFRDNANESGISTFWFLSVPCVGVLKGEHARMVLRSSSERTTFSIHRRHFTESLGKDSLVLSPGGHKSTWRHNRNVVKHAFTTNTVNSMFSKVWKVANDFSDTILKEVGDMGSYHCEGFELFKSVTAEIFGSLALGYNFESVKNLTVPSLVSSFDHMMQDSESRCQPRTLLNPFQQFYWLPTKKNAMRKDHTRNLREQLTDICKAKASVLEEDPTRDDDFLSNLLKSRTRSNSKLNQADFGEIIEVLLTILVAGYDTVAIALSYTMWFLAANPQVQEECAREARHASTVSPTLKEDPLQWASRLAYCRAVVLEAMRLNPPVYMIGRSMVKDIELDGCIVPSGTRVNVPIILVHTDKRNFHRPMEFLPERWVKFDRASQCWVERDCTQETYSTEAAANDPNYIPAADPRYHFGFSDGVRDCPGRRLAMVECTMIMASIIRDLSVDVRPGHELKVTKKFVIAPPEDMPLIFRPREGKEL